MILRRFADYLETARQGFSGDLVYALLATLVYVAALFLIHRAFGRFLSRRVEDPSRRYEIRKGESYVYGTLLVLGLLWIWMGAGGGVALGAYFGILSVGIAIALKEPIASLAGWFYIKAREPYRISDRIEIAGRNGDVVDIDIFTTTLLEIDPEKGEQSTGRIVHIPNGWVFLHSIMNAAEEFPYIWNETRVTIPFEADRRRAREVLEAVLKEKVEDLTPEVRQSIRRASRYLIRYQHLTPAVWTKISDHGITFTLRYLCPIRTRRQRETLLQEAILDEFEREEIPLAYPAVRQYQHRETFVPVDKKS